MLIPSFSISKYLTQSNLSHDQLTNDQISTSTHWEKQKLLLNPVKLDLGYDSLVGSIVSLFSLLSLQKLRFSNNRLLSQLDTLYLSSNIFEERIIMLRSRNLSSSNETRSTEIPIFGSFGGQPSVIPTLEETSYQKKNIGRNSSDFWACDWLEFNNSRNGFYFWVGDYLLASNSFEEVEDLVFQTCWWPSFLDVPKAVSWKKISTSKTSTQKDGAEALVIMRTNSARLIMVMFFFSSKKKNKNRNTKINRFLKFINWVILVFLVFFSYMFNRIIT